MDPPFPLTLSSSTSVFGPRFNILVKSYFTLSQDGSFFGIELCLITCIQCSFLNKKKIRVFTFQTPPLYSLLKKKSLWKWLHYQRHENSQVLMSKKIVREVPRTSEWINLFSLLVSISEMYQQRILRFLSYIDLKCSPQKGLCIIYLKKWHLTEIEMC